MHAHAIYTVHACSIMSDVPEVNKTWGGGGGGGRILETRQ